MTEPEARDDAVLDVVSMIPAGALASYGDIADVVAVLGVPCTPRQAARTLSRFGSGVPWWRVVQAGGTVADEVLPQARTRLVAEGIVVVGRRVPLAQLRWEPDLEALRTELELGG